MSIASRIRNADKSKVLGEEFVKKHEYRVSQLNEVYNFLQTKISEFRKMGLNVFFADSKIKMVKPKIEYFKASMDDKDYKKAMDSMIEVKDEIRHILENKRKEEALKKKLEADKEEYEKAETEGKNENKEENK